MIPGTRNRLLVELYRRLERRSRPTCQRCHFRPVPCFLRPVEVGDRILERGIRNRHNSFARRKRFRHHLQVVKHQNLRAVIVCEPHLVLAGLKIREGNLPAFEGVSVERRRLSDFHAIHKDRDVFEKSITVARRHAAAQPVTAGGRQREESRDAALIEIGHCAAFIAQSETVLDLNVPG